MSDYGSWGLAQWLENLEQSHAHQPIALGLERIAEVGKRLGILNFTCPVVTVAGTNGKGSTVASLGALVLQAGFKVGTYTSPHLLKFNERIQIAGICVSDQQLCAAFLTIKTAQGSTSLTFFEFTTLAAFILFQQATCDLIILEVGMGGRLDAVNVVDPQLAIVTSIGHDHQAFLGETLAEIAQEKAGIFRPQIPVLVGKQAQISSLLNQGEKLQSHIYLEGRDFRYSASTWEWCQDRDIISLPAHFLPPQSVSLALAAYTILGMSHLKLPPLTKVIGVLDRKMMIGRCQELTYQGKQIILDVGHNGQASEWLAHRLQVDYSQHKKIAVWASLVDKPLAAIVSAMHPIIDTWFVGGLPGNTRGPNQALLTATLTRQGIEQFYAFADIKMAFTQALAWAKKEDVIVVFGSFYVISEIYEHFFTAQLLHENGLVLMGKGKSCLTKLDV